MLLIPIEERGKKKEIDYSKIQEAPLLLKFINKRNRKGLSTMVFVIGLRGSGKSSLCQRLGQLIKEQRPEAEISIVDSLLELLKAIRKSKEGDIIVIEEITVLFPSRRSMSGENVAISKVLDTIRKKQLIIFTNCPIWKSIDNNMKASGDVIIETLKIIKTEGMVKAKFHRIQVNPFSGQVFRHTFQNNKGQDINRLYTRMPNLEKWNEYEKDKDIFLDDLYKREQLKQEKKKRKEDKELGINKPNVSIDTLSPQYKQIWYYHTVEQLKQQDIAEKMKLSQPSINQILKKINNFDKISQNT
ncbi:MAG: sigma-70 family RNA polymerase sigma factor [Ignavibacteriales bacterium]|nr:MAG: sigma-70 family RNA polymerase sigma factor [Ignavibacteriales bacterium]